MGVLDRAEGMLAGLLTELLLGNITANEDHDALFVFVSAAEGLEMGAAYAVSWNLLKVSVKQ
jgi:hypothetical protein